MKILVIGGAGYIGSHVVKALLQKKHQVVVFDNLSTGLRENLLPGSIFRYGDILQISSLEKVCEEFSFEGLIHLAALKAAGESMLDPEKYSSTNIVGSLNIIHTAVKYKIPYFVFSSSAATFGEPKYLPIDENHPTQPENYYGFTKLEIEGFLNWYSKLKGFHFAALRYFNAAGYDPDGVVFGLEQNPANLLPVIMEVASGKRSKLQVFGNDYPTEDGTGVRDYIHVSDLADAHVKSFDFLQREKKNLIIGLGSENGLSVLQMIETAKRITKRQIPYEIVPRRPGDPAKLVASSKMAESLLGWKANFSDADT